MKKLSILIAAICMVSIPFAGQSFGATTDTGPSTLTNEQLPTTPELTAKEIEALMRPDVSSGFYTIKGKLLKSDGGDLVVQEPDGRRVRVHREEGTIITNRVPNAGDMIEARVNDANVAFSISVIANSRTGTASHVLLPDPLMDPFPKSSPKSWITIAAADTYIAPWVKDIEKELMQEQFRMLWSNDPRSPQAAVMYLLNDAAKALAVRNDVLAKDFVSRALNVLEEGIAKGYYSQSDIDPIVNYIKAHTPVRMS
jgi:hypothetical protein